MVENKDSFSNNTMVIAFFPILYLAITAINEAPENISLKMLKT